MVWFLIYNALEVYKWLIVLRAVLAWAFPPDSPSTFVYLIRRATDPVLRPISNILPDTGRFDVSPIVAFLGITVVQQVIRAIG